MRFGGRTDLGRSAWLYSGATTINISLTGAAILIAKRISKTRAREMHHQTTGLDTRFLAHVIRTGKRRCPAFETDRA